MFQRKLRKTTALLLVVAMLCGFFPGVDSGIKIVNAAPDPDMGVTAVSVTSPGAIQVTMNDIGLQASDVTITDNTNPGSMVAVSDVSYTGGKYTFNVTGSAISYYDIYTLQIQKEGYNTYTNSNIYYGTLATDSDLDLVNEPNKFATYTRTYEDGTLAIKNSVYEANALLYPGSPLYNAIDTTNGLAPSAAIGDYKVVGAFVKAPAGAKGAKSLFSNGIMTQLGEDSLIDSNPNFQETVASGKAYPGNTYWQTISFAPVYMKTAIKQNDASWLLYDPADRLRVIEWYDNEACTGTPMKIVRFNMTVEYTGLKEVDPSVQLNHEQTITRYNTIQAAVNAAVDGDTVNVGAGIYREQVTITKNITLQGAGEDKTIIEAPNSADLVQSGNNMKNLKNQDLFAIVAVQTSTDGLVTIKDLKVDGRDQGFLSDARYPDKNSYAFQGISVVNSDATIDNVTVTRVRELATDFGANTPAGYLPADQPSGMNHNESIFAESAYGLDNHTLTVTNCYISKFQKTAILVWGPTLVVDIHDNIIQGYGQTLYSTGNGIQVASSDRTGQGGTNGDRRGTTGVIKNNQILNLGLVIPEPGQPGSYLNLGLYGPAGILLYQAGNGIEISGNIISGPGIIPWHNSTISNDGGYSNEGVIVYDSPNARILSNTVSGFGTGIYEEHATSGSRLTVSGNTLSNNLIDVWTHSGDDQITLGAGSEVVGYNQTGNGTDVITNFGAGDKINVIGFANGSVNGCIGAVPVVDFTGGTVTAGDGTNVAEHSVQTSVAGSVTTLFVDTDGVADSAELQIKLAGIYSPENFVLDGGYIKYKPQASCTPADNAVEITPDTDLVLNYSENVFAVAGKKIVIKKTTDDSIVETIDAAAGNVAVSGSVVTINPTANLCFSTEYYVLVDEGAFKTINSTDLQGISGKTSWSFTTEMKSEVTAYNSSELAHYIANPNISVINLVNGTTYQYTGGTISRGLTINGNGAIIVAGIGVQDTIIRSDDITVSSAALGNYADKQTFLKVEGTGSSLTLNNLTLKNGVNKYGGNTDADGIFAVINVKTGGSLAMDHVTLEGFHNNPSPGNNLSFGIHAEPKAVSTTIQNCTFDKSNAFRNAIAIRSGAMQISNNTFEGTEYPGRLRQSDGYEYAIYIYGGNGSISQNTITGYNSTTQKGYASAGIAVIGFYSTDVNITNNALSFNESGIDITKTWSPWSSNTVMKVNGKALNTSEDAYAIGEALKAANSQVYVSASLDQNDEVEVGPSGGKYFTVLGGYRSPFLSVISSTTTSASICFPDTDVDSLNAVDKPVEFEKQVDNDTTWTLIGASILSTTSASIALEENHVYRIRAKLTHKSYAEPGDPTARTLVTYSNPVTINTYETYTVSFNVDGGSAVDSQSINYNAKATKPADPTKTGYTFAGWYDSSALTAEFDFANTAITAATTIYAKWNSVSSNTNSTNNTQQSTVVVLVNGKSENIGTGTTSQEGDKTVTTVTIDEKKLQEKLEAEGQKAVVTIPVNDKSDVVVGELNGQMVKNMENKQAVLEVKTEKVSYTLPAQQINIDDVSQKLGSEVELKDIKVQVEIADPTADTVKVVENSAKKGEFTIVAAPVEFTVKCKYGGKTVEINSFNSYVERMVAIPEGIDPSKITTGIVVEADGTVRHVPTKITVIDGKYYAKINSLTNSTYSVVWHPLEFTDVAAHWAKDAVNDMGSRMVVGGVGDGLYAPDRDITRAEFAAIMVKALGLKPGTGNNPFSDVENAEWYADFIETAYAHGIISGYGNGNFGPQDKITREQAMTMIAKAMNITGLKMDLSNSDLENIFAGYTDSDKVISWARESIAKCIKSGIVSGRSGNVIDPKDNITRAEVAVIVRKLLQKSNLI